MNLKADRRLEVGSPVMVGNRKMFVVSEVLLFHDDNGVAFAGLLSPVALIVFEGSLEYSLPLEEGSKVTLEDLILKDPSIQEKLSFYKI
jgi:hypothetical protein